MSFSSSNKIDKSNFLSVYLFVVLGLKPAPVTLVFTRYSHTTYRHFQTNVIDHIHDSRHDGFYIIMRISHVVCQGANNKMMPLLRKSARLNSKISSPKSHLRAKLWNNDFMIKVSLKKLLGYLTCQLHKPFYFYKSVGIA